MSARLAAGSANSSAPRKRPAALAAGLAMNEFAMILEDTLEHALLLAHDGRGLAFRGRLAECLVLIDALLFGRRIDHLAIGLRLAPEHQGIGKGPGIGFV